jgi:GTPase SAR1 family protein
MNEVEKHANDNISRILVGNKSDLEDLRQVSTDEGKELAEHYNVRFLETSAKDCKNVEEAFTMMTREIKSRVAITQPPKGGRNVQEGATRISKLSQNSKKLENKKSNCC